MIVDVLCRLLVDYKGSKVAVVAGTRWEEYKIFRQPNLLLRVDLGGPKMAVSNGLFEKGYRYVVEEGKSPLV